MDNEPVKIIEPTEEMFRLADYYLELVRHAIPSAQVTLIGSLAIPVCTKDEIDLLVEIDESLTFAEVQQIIENNSEGKIWTGPMIEDEAYMRTKKKFGTICELHIVYKGSPKANKYHQILNQLKSDKKLSGEYSSLKRSLDGLALSEYKKEKRKFLEKHNLSTTML